MVLYCVSLGLSFCFVVVLLHAITQCSDMLCCIARAIVLCLLASVHEFVFAAIHIWVCVFAAVYAAQPSVCALLYDSTLGASTNTRHYLSFSSWCWCRWFTTATAGELGPEPGLCIWDNWSQFWNDLFGLWETYFGIKSERKTFDRRSRSADCRLVVESMLLARIRSNLLIGNLRIFHRLHQHKWPRNARYEMELAELGKLSITWTVQSFPMGKHPYH